MRSFLDNQNHYFLGGLEESKLFLKALKLVTLAESLGGYESLAELPYLMTHASIEEKERVSLGVTNNLIRLSVGLENPQDLIEDLDQALKAACQVVRKWFNLEIVKGVAFAQDVS